MPTTKIKRTVVVQTCPTSLWACHLTRTPAGPLSPPFPCNGSESESTRRERIDTWTVACPGPFVEVLKVWESLYRLLLQVAFLRVRVFASAASGTILQILFESVAVRARVFGYICISAKGFVRGLSCPARLSGKLYASGVCAQDECWHLFSTSVSHISLIVALAFSLSLSLL